MGTMHDIFQFLIICHWPQTVNLYSDQSIYEKDSTIAFCLVHFLIWLSISSWTDDNAVLIRFSNIEETKIKNAVDSS